MNKKIFISALILIGSIAGLYAQSNKNESKSGFGLAVGGSLSTNGAGVNVIAAITPSIAVRLGYEQLDRSFDNLLSYSIEDTEFSISPSVKAGGLSGNVDFYLLRGLYLTGGVVSTNLNLGVTLEPTESMKMGDITYEPEDLGQLNISILPERRMAPYAGIGFGRTISRNKRVAFNLEMGAFHMGSYVIEMSGTKLFEGNSDNESVQRINDVLQDISWSGIYPVLKVGLSFRIL
jgi:hypothetical protein